MDLHKTAQQLISTVPDFEGHLSKPEAALIAVERHDRDSEEWSSEPRNAFLWIKGNTKLQIKKIRQAYIQQYQDRQPDLSVSIMSNENSVLPDDAIVSDMDYYGDGLLVLAAVKLESAGTREQSSMPLGGLDPTTLHNAPAFYDLSAEPHAPALYGAARQPRQPVTQPISVPLRQSHDETQSMKPHISQTSLASIDYGPEDFICRLKVRTESNPAWQATPPEIKTEQPTSGDQPPSGDPPSSQEQDYKPREYDDPAMERDDEPEPTVRGQSIRELAENTTPERLEAGVKASLDVLAQLQVPLQKLHTEDAKKWLTRIENIRKEATKTRTVIGVVGNTGSGKSSVINAMLDEERLVPTNCMRACTAVVTELSFNDSNSEKSRYRAEIEFVQPAEWKKELNILVKEVFDDKGHMIADARSSDSTAGIAYAKIRAVYHEYTQEMLSKATVASLMCEPKVKSILGTTERIVQATSQAFYRRLQQYVDSKERNAENFDENGSTLTDPNREFEYWPLIKVVKIYTKAEALSTGAVVVDLPGLHDSNAARAAVAESYMKQCTRLWIVAPITRAVDDKAAKTLLENTFRRQLKYDGTYSAVTFICSKTDDISQTEATDSLKLGAEMQDIEDQLTRLGHESETLLQKLELATCDKRDQEAAVDDVEDQLEKWDDLQSKFEDGETVYAPAPIAMKKRKRPTHSPISKKKHRTNLGNDDNIEHMDLASDEESERDKNATATPGRSRTPLTGEQIEEKIKELKSVKRNARRLRAELDAQRNKFVGEIKEVTEREAELKERRTELCITGRNKYSKSAIQEDFAARIKELDQENGEEDDPDNFDPDEDMRDYKEVAESLPVFCVSSRAYQKLCDRMKKDSEVPGFTTMEQTGIPQLQAHCKKLTEQGRVANCRRFLNSMNQLMSSLGLWASDDGTGIQLTAQQRNAVKDLLQRGSKRLRIKLKRAVNDAFDDIAATLSKYLFEKFQPAIATAKSSAVSTASKWGGPRDSGGLHIATYKATVRRGGVYEGTSGFQDFNQQLFNPVQKRLAPGWEKIFQHRLPHILQASAKTGGKLLTQFHAAIETHFKENGYALARVAILGNALNGYEATLNDIPAQVVAQINDGQREINREFTPVIMSCMDTAYQLCTGERGRGSFNRMKDHMSRHVARSKLSMFDNACDEVRNGLTQLMDKSRKSMLERVGTVYSNVQDNYNSLVRSGEIQQDSLPAEERAVRREVDEVVTNADGVFRVIIDSDAGDLREKAMSDGNVEEVDADEGHLFVSEESNEDSGVDDDESIEAEEE